MKIANRILSAVAAVCMASTVLMYPRSNFHGKYADHVSLTTNAEEYKTSDLELEYKVLDDGTVEITKYISSTSKDIEIPSAIDGKRVTSIGDDAFYCCMELKSINIPDSVTNIGDKAFALCKNLTSITLPDGVTSIGDNAFQWCDNLISITIPDSVTSIGNGLFDGCENLTSITLPDSVTSIGYYAFNFCENLTSITIPNGVTSIENWTFNYCPRLTSITIPDSVMSIGNGAFYYCSGLTSISIPDSVMGIGENAFHSCSGLTSIIIPDSVTSIGYQAFCDCTSLKSITIKNPDCEIFDRISTLPDNTVIYGYKNSTAQKYAEKYGNTFVELGNEVDVSFKIADLVTLQKWLLNDNGEFADWERYDVYKDNQLDVYDLVLMRQNVLENSK